jgi:hypothetical protein
MQCYLTGDLIDDRNRSLEHIIPNALGGVFSSRSILSSAANLSLGSTVDVKFNKIFEGTYRRLPLDKDRKNTRGFQGIHQFFKAEAIYKEGRWFPKKPYYDAETQTLYAESKKNGEGYIGHLKNRAVISADQEVNIRTDFSGWFEIPFNLENNDFAQGLAKIAAGYAAFHGVKREDLVDVIDLDKKAFKEHGKLVILPYFPVHPVEPIFELNAHESVHYPVHALSLIGNPDSGFLFCYVELFSTFQFVVVLNKAYQGRSLHETYIYDLLASKELTNSEYVRGVMNNELLIAQLKEFKLLTELQLDEIVHIMTHESEKLRMYTNIRFRQLETFVAFIDIARKLDLLK